MSRTKRFINSGWYVSQKNFLEEGFKTTIYTYDSVKNEWSVFSTGEKVRISALPETPTDMWPVRLISR